jgi:hypothetical protein
MRILITGKSMEYLSGQPLYCYELAKELSKEHCVVLASKWIFATDEAKKMRANLEKAGVQCVEPSEVATNFDLQLASEFCIIGAGPVINIVHSELDCESPIEDLPIGYIGIRLSVVDHLSQNHGIDRRLCRVIYNGVDSERFKPKEKAPRDYKLIVVPCTFDANRAKFIEHMAGSADKDTHVVFVGKDFGHAPKENEFVKVLPELFDVENIVQDADEVAGTLRLGRVNIEANFCGVKSVIYDSVTLDKTEFFLERAELEQKHDIKNVSKQILNFYDDIISGKLTDDN